VSERLRKDSGSDRFMQKRGVSFFFFFANTFQEWWTEALHLFQRELFLFFRNDESSTIMFQRSIIASASPQAAHALEVVNFCTVVTQET
jgi:hypothetical protein